MNSKPPKQRKPPKKKSPAVTSTHIVDRTDEYLGKSITITGGGARPNKRGS